MKRNKDLMKKAFSLLFFLLLTLSVFAFTSSDTNVSDTTQVIRLNSAAFNERLTDPDQTVQTASKALNLARQLDYTKGIAEAYRVMGIGLYYKSQVEKAIDSYLNALSYFQKANSKRGMASVYNNIGNLYFDSNDYDRALDYFQRALKMAESMSNDQLIATIGLNLGNIYYRKLQYNQALQYYNKTEAIFEKNKKNLNEDVLLGCIQNKGVIYYHLNQLDEAERLLLQANQKAKSKDLNLRVASIDLTLSALYLSKQQYDVAEKFVKEGFTYSELAKSKRYESDFKYTSYQLEFKRKNYEKALNYLQQIYRQDSLSFYNNVSAQLGILQAKYKQEETQREAEYRQKLDRFLFWASTIVAGLLLVVIALLVGNVKRKARTNQRLTELNAEVSRQKDNVDRINHHLEEIIDERTKDLQIKNKKLSEYSSYLSHQIRGPIATLKGLINLEKEGLVNKEECFNMMDKCVSEIDDKIIDMSDMLHDPERTSLSGS